MQATETKLVVCCLKWGTRYPPHYVNRLRRMVGRRLVHPHDFVCLTEDPAGLDEGIRPVPLPDRLIGFWNKISLFRRGIFDPGATLIFLDLDLVIVGSIDFLLGSPGDFRAIGSWGSRAGFNSSVMRFQADAHVGVYDRFIADADAIVASGRYAGDQSWIKEQIPEAAFFPSEKIVSYKRDLNSHFFPLAKKLGWGPDWLKAPHFMTVEPSPNAAIVVFHGKPDPEDVMDTPYGPWKRAPFVKEHWR